VVAYRGRALDAVRLTSAGLRRVPPDETDLRVHLLVDLARWQSFRLRLARALETLARAEHLVEGHATPRLRVHLHRGRTLAILGDREGAERDLTLARQLAHRLGAERMLGRACLFLAELDVF